MAHDHVPPDIPQDVLQVTQRFRFLGQICQFSWHYRGSAAAPTRADSIINVAALNRVWLAVVVPTIQTILSSGTTFLDSRVYSLIWPDIATNILDSGALVGQRPGDPLPPQVAQVFSKRTSFRGRCGRGRSYMGGMSETDSTSGQPNPAYLLVVGPVATNMNQAITDVVSGKTFTPVVISKLNSGPILPPPVLGAQYHAAGNDITTVTADDIWYTQRRRTIGRGQ